MDTPIIIDFFKNFNSKDAQDITFEQLADLIRSDENTHSTATSWHRATRRQQRL